MGRVGNREFIYPVVTAQNTAVNLSQWFQCSNHTLLLGNGNNSDFWLVTLILSLSLVITDINSLCHHRCDCYYIINIPTKLLLLYIK